MGTPGKKSPSWEDRPVMTKMIEHVDHRIGDLMATLDELGLKENTLVIFTSDNGGTPASVNAPLRGFKQGVLDGGIRVPAIVRWPCCYPANEVSHQPGILMDFSRTILEATGSMSHLDAGRELDGIDLTPLLTGNETYGSRTFGWRRREWDLGQNGYNNVWAEAYIKDEWKYIKEFAEAPAYARSVEGEYPSSGYIELLYNLSEDIHEEHNLASTHLEKLDQLRSELARWKRDVAAGHKHYRIPFPDQYARR
jgi:N-acetylgalactosamine-6-sulfatase